MRVRVASALIGALAFIFVSAGGNAAPATPSVSFITPHDGSTVAGPRVEVALSVRGLNLVAAGSKQEAGDGHAHVLVDIPKPADRSYLSTDDPRIVHLGKPPFDSRAIALDNGQHTLTAVLGDSEHLVVSGQRSSTIHITVADGYRGQGALSPGCSNLATGAAAVKLTFPTDGGTVQGTITAHCAFQTQNGACTWIDTAFSRVDGTYGADNQHLTGRTSGRTQRRLRSGDRKSCGEDRESQISPSVLQADVNADTVNGTVSEAHFTLTKDDTVDLDPAPEPLANSAKASSAKPIRKYIAYAAFALAAALLVYAGLSLARARKSVA